MTSGRRDRRSSAKPSKQGKKNYVALAQLIFCPEERDSPGQTTVRFYTGFKAVVATATGGGGERTRRQPSFSRQPGDTAVSRKQMTRHGCGWQVQQRRPKQNLRRTLSREAKTTSASS
ncbi:unnamed protein product [Soboliphyme baturini]|uniref:Uncharacterized protein n=1 Tax=Soboliphyme baturini TaxID=241478 RepID=A0A183IMJ3_9BILA|nr:unnamed protein product [Soboliphyme baturini]